MPARPRRALATCAFGSLSLLAALGLGTSCTGEITGERGDLDHGDDISLSDGGIRLVDSAVSPDGGGAGTPDGTVGVDAAVFDGEPPGLVGTVAAHNEVRAGVGVGPLTWDPALAAIAQAWGEQCIDNVTPTGLVDHNPDRSDNYPGYVGENISGYSIGTQAVAQWAAEEAHYDYDANTCADGEQCGHYTQVVWESTTKVGCAIAVCPDLTWNAVICNYAPGGNINGERPY